MRMIVKKSLLDLKRIIEEISVPEDKEISQASVVLVTAHFEGPDAERLAQETGYPRAFIDGIVTRMQQAALWSKNVVDDREWWNAQGEFKGERLFAHALVALGQVKREETPTSIRYIEVSSGDVVGEYSPVASLQRSPPFRVPFSLIRNIASAVSKLLASFQ